MIDCELEARIEKVGRDHVFAEAQALGWGNGRNPPKWVWNQICAVLEHDQNGNGTHKPDGKPPQTGPEAKGGNCSG